jgi:hypothetical protein
MGRVTVRRTILWLVVASSTACFTKPDRPPEPADIDGPSARPHIVGKNRGNNITSATMSYPLAIPAGDSLLLIAGVALGANCTEPIPSVLEISAGGVQLTRLESIVGTPCGGGSRSEQWILAQPPAGDMVLVTFVLDAPATSFHTMAMAIDGVHPTQPIRNSATNFGRGTTSTVVVDSGATDLVIDTIGQGGAISGPGAAQNREFQMNQSGDTTLDNSGASSKPGADGRVTMTWEFSQNDEWQTIATSIKSP